MPAEFWPLLLIYAYCVSCGNADAITGQQITYITLAICEIIKRFMLMPVENNLYLGCKIKLLKVRM